MMRMHVAVVTYQLKLFGIESLKERRSFVKKLVNRIRKQLNVSVAEIGNCDSKTSVEIGIAVISSSQKITDSVVRSVTKIVESTHGAELIDYEREQW